MALNMTDGVHVALITPTDSQGVYQPSVMETIIDRAMPMVQGFSILGSTGEGPMLPWSTKEAVIAHVVGFIKGRRPISCGIAALSVAQCIEECQRAGDLGVDVALVLPPFYYPARGSEVLDFYQAVADQSPIPLMIYHIPQFTKVPLSVDTVIRLNSHKNIVGMKDSSMDFGFFQRVRLRAFSSFKLYTGSDDLLVASSLAGGNGTICASGNVAPVLASNTWVDVRLGRIDEAWTTQNRLITLVDGVRAVGAGRAWKAAVEMARYGEAKPLAPLAALSDAERVLLKELLMNAGVLVL